MNQCTGPGTDVTIPEADRAVTELGSGRVILLMQMASLFL
jgi:hypothetical protein